jgi:lipopolysaccharide exporter
MPSVSERALTAVRWSYIGVVARGVSQLVANIVLARILGPEAFGIFAITLLMVAPAKLVAEMGMGSALIQKEIISRDDVHIVFTWLHGVGILTAVAFYFSANYAAGFFGNSAASESIRFASIIFLFYPATIIAASQLQRNLNLKAIQIANVLSYLFGFLVVGLGCALMGMGSLSLVLAFVSQAVVECVLLVTQAKPHLRLRLQKIDEKLVHFGTRVVSANLTNWFLDSVDNILIGKIFGTKSLGLYAVVFNFVRTPTGHLTTTLQNVLFSTSSRFQHDNARLGQTYIAVISAIALIAFPLFAGVAAIAETCVIVVYGERWQEAAALLTPLALAMPFHCLTAVTGPILWGTGRVGKELRVSFVMGLVMILVLLLLSNISLVAVVWGVFGVYLLRALWMIATLTNICSIPLRRILDALVPGLILGLIVGASLLMLNYQLVEFYFTPSIRLAFAIALAMLLSLIWLVFVGQRSLPAELNQMIKRLIANRPFLQKCWARCGA